MKAYISGPMTGLPDYNRPAFHEVAAILRDAGYEVLNPAEIEIANGSWQDYMRKDIAMLAESDVVFMLDDWFKSKGARIEYDLADKLGIEIEIYHQWNKKRLRSEYNESVEAL